MKYPIWRHFSPEARRAAATAVYYPTVAAGFARTAQGCCPLAVALAVDGHDGHRLTPGGRLVARLLRDAALVAPASRFVNDWDGGKIRRADLPRLLEVTP